MKKLGLIFILLLPACKTLEPVYLAEPISVGRDNVGQYWIPKRSNQASSIPSRIKYKLYANGGMIFYSYKVDSNGITRDVTLEKTIPANLITLEDFKKSKLYFSKFKPSKSNSSKQPVKVYARQVFSKSSKALIIPPSHLSDEEVIKDYSDAAFN